MSMIVIMANLPLESSVDNILIFSAGSQKVRTLKPRSPAAVLVLADWSGESSQKNTVGKDLTQVCSWHLGDGGKVVRNVSELQIGERRQVARQLSNDH